MDTIRNYLENMFLALPQTPEVLRAKEELYTMMEDKYLELKASGKTENEAIGIVIAEFGNLEELAETLGLTGNFSTETASDQTEPLRIISADEADEYLRYSKKAALQVALGVMLCIFAPVPLIYFSGMSELAPFSMSEGTTIFMGLLLLFVLVAVAVALFIVQGTSEDYYKHLKKESFQLDTAALSYVEMLHSQFRASFTVQISIGVVLCILSVIPLLGSAIFFPERQELHVTLTCLLLILVGIGVFLLVHAGMISESFQVLMQDAEYTPQSKAIKRDEIMKGISSSYWSIVTLLYLGISFLFHCWGISWIIWVAAASFEPILRKMIKAKRAGK